VGLDHDLAKGKNFTAYFKDNLAILRPQERKKKSIIFSYVFANQDELKFTSNTF
jgi:hypothetical protein